MTTGHATAVLVMATALALATPPRATGQSTSIDEVWALEQRAWKLAAMGDVENYVTFFHDGYVGWPCTYAKPASKATIGNWVREIRDSKAKFIYDLRLEAAHDFGGVVVLVSSTTIAEDYPDGRRAGLSGRYKITHTWFKVDSTWLAIGGMCGIPEQPTQ